MQNKDEGSLSHLEDHKTINGSYAQVNMLTNSIIVGDTSQYPSITRHNFKQARYIGDCHLLVSLLILIPAEFVVR